MGEMTDQISQAEEHGAQVQAEAIEWAERNNYEVFEDSPADGWLYIKMGSYKGLHIDEYGAVELKKRRHLCNEEGEVSFGEKRMTVTDERGNSYYISDNSFPIDD